MPTNPNLLLCNGVNASARRPKEWASANTHELATFGPAKNVRLKIADLTDRMAMRLPDRVRDLVELAALVYAADQSCKRVGGVTIDYGDKWHRTFRFEVAVRDVDFWTQPKVLNCLSDTLGFLSEDNYEFVFSRMSAPPQFQDYLEFSAKMPDPEPVQRVVLFSGGLDSLAGAVEEVLVQKNRVALVSHKPVDHLAKKQRELVAEIARRAGDPRLKPAHFPVLANRIGEVEGDHTQRTRSFLYASLAAAVANYFALNSLYFYENGVVSVNLPLCAQEVGGRATRTTHPQTLDGYGQLFSLVMDSTFGVENGLMWDTKEDVVRRLVNAGHADLVKNSLSCSHTRQYTMKAPHCGMCSQCLSRRVATLGASVGDHDPGGGYRADVLLEPRKKDPDRILAERFVGFARQVEAMQSVAEFHQKFSGELARVYPYLKMPPSVGAEKLFDLHHRHAEQVGKVMLGAMQQYAELRRTGQMPDTCVVNYAFDAGITAAARPVVVAETRQSKEAAADERSAATEVDASRKPASRDDAALPFDIVESAFQVSMGGRQHTFDGRQNKLFALFRRISRRPGHRVDFHALRQQGDVWDGSQVEDSSIRSAVFRLKAALKSSELNDLADAISTGSFQNRPYVILSLDRLRANSNGDQTEIAPRSHGR